MTTTETPLRWTKTTTGRYAATQDGIRYVAQRGPKTDWELTIQPTTVLVGVEIVDSSRSQDWHEAESLRDLKVIAQAYADLKDESRGDRFRKAISLGYDRLMGR